MSDDDAERLSADQAEFSFVVDTRDEGEFAPIHFDLHEHMSEPFLLRLDTLRSRDLGKEPALKDLVGQAARFTLAHSGGKRHFVGVVSAVRVAGERANYRVYRFEVRSEMWLLTQRSHCRVFQAMPTHEIVEKVLEDAGIDHKAILVSVSNTHGPRDMCVQYNETDYDFISRLMEEEGLFWYQAWRADDQFVDDEDGDAFTFVISDQSMIHTKIPEGRTLIYRPPQMTGGAGQFVTGLAMQRALRPTSVEHTDYDFREPARNVSKIGMATFASSDSFDTVPLEDRLELAHAPGNYTIRDVSGTGKDAPAEGGRLGLDPTDARDRVDDDVLGDLAMVRADAARSDAVVFEGRSDVRSLRTGFLVEIDEHTSPIFNAEFLVLGVKHEGTQSPPDDPDWRRGDDEPAYANTFRLLPSELQYRPPQVTPRPRVEGVHTAIVTGPSNEEIHVDDMMRIKVRFPWNAGPEDDASSAWVRVASFWAGAGYGHVAIPRVGWEVAVQFVEGNPDRPIVIGTLFNGLSKPPYALPEHKTRMSIKSQSTGGGGGFNELRFEDLDGEEEVFLHAQKALNVHVKGSASKGVGGDDGIDISGKQSTHVGKEMTVTVDKGYELTVTDKIKMEGKAGTTLVAPTTLVQSTTGDGKITLEGLNEIRLVVGSSSLSIKKDGITLDASKITLKGSSAVDVSAPTVEAKGSSSMKAHDGSGNGLEVASGSTKVKGTQLTMEGTAQFKLSGPVGEVSATGVLTVKGSMVKLNG